MSKILIVEDDPQFRSMLEQMLARDGHQVTAAKNGVDGLDRYYHTRPDLMITDILMPEKDGIELILAILRKEPAARIIAISGGRRGISADFNLESASLMGVKSILAKPFSHTELKRAIHDALA
ncbi:Response regulator receiver protein [Gammaproteobacteria bacterium]